MTENRQIYLGLSFPSGAETRVVGITSALRQEGRTSVAVGVATAMAADTLEPTLLLECDLEQPSFGNIFGFHSAPGLTEWLEGTAPLRLIRVVPLENEFVLPIGSSLVDPARIIYRLTQSSLMEQLRPRFRNVVIDLPPVVNLAYGALASKLADRVVLVVRHGVTPIEDLEKSIALLGKERLAGIVLNQEVLKTPAWIRRLL